MVNLRQGVYGIGGSGTVAVTDSPVALGTGFGRAVLVQNDVDSADSVLVGNSQGQAYRLLPGTSETFPGNPASIRVKTLNEGETATVRWLSMQ